VYFCLYCSSEWINISAEAKDLVMAMLTVDPRKRISATEALLHPWVTRKGHTDEHKQHLSGAHDNIKENVGNKKETEGGGGLSIYRRTSNYIGNALHASAK